METTTQQLIGTRNVSIMKGKTIHITQGDRNFQDQLQVKLVQIENDISPITSFQLVSSLAINQVEIRKVRRTLNLVHHVRNSECSFLNRDMILSWLYYEQEKTYHTSFFAKLEKTESFLVFCSRNNYGDPIIYRIFVNKLQQVFLSVHRPEYLPYIFSDASVGFLIGFRN